MAWTIKWHPKAAKNLRSLSDDIRSRVIKRVDKLQENPFRFLERFAGKDFYKFRAGDYRALVDIDFKNRIIEIQVFDHRSRIYKRGR